MWWEWNRETKRQRKGRECRETDGADRDGGDGDVVAYLGLRACKRVSRGTWAQGP